MRSGRKNGKDQRENHGFGAKRGRCPRWLISEMQHPPEGSDSYNEYLQKTADEMWLISTDSIADARFFDIKIEKNGEKYEPEYPAKVTIKYENADRQ